jgi:hypothetical protein
MAKSETGKKAKAATGSPSPKKPAKKPSKTASTKAAAKSAAQPEPTRAVVGPDSLDGVGLPTTHGKVGVFGGPKDRGIKPDDKLGLPTGRHFVYERVRSLNPNSFYCAMRWDYHVAHKSPEEAKRWWANKKILVSNPANGKAVVVRSVDHGPHEKTGLDISISPGAAEALGVQVGDEVDIAFADQKAPLGLTE